MIDKSAMLLQISYACFALAACAVGIAGIARVRSAANSTGQRSAGSLLAAVSCVVLCLGVSLLLVLVGWHGDALRGIIAKSSSMTPQPTTLARHLTVILSSMLVVFAGWGLQGIMHAIVTFTTPVAKPESSLESTGAA